MKLSTLQERQRKEILQMQRTHAREIAKSAPWDVVQYLLIVVTDLDTRIKALEKKVKD